MIVGRWELPIGTFFEQARFFQLLWSYDETGLNLDVAKDILSYSFYLRKENWIFNKTITLDIHQIQHQTHTIYFKLDLTSYNHEHTPDTTPKAHQILQTYKATIKRKENHPN